ncbi:MAG TPA: hypothetical protein VJI75_00690 [Candidatus Nanoarchaeia archaeon]|nr:hypothetical protein [Candidatus Nanoarchaeia archaeon]
MEGCRTAHELFRDYQSPNDLPEGKTLDELVRLAVGLSERLPEQSRKVLRDVPFSQSEIYIKAALNNPYSQPRICRFLLDLGAHKNLSECLVYSLANAAAKKSAFKLLLGLGPCEETVNALLRVMPNASIEEDIMRILGEYGPVNTVLNPLAKGIGGRNYHNMAMELFKEFGPSKATIKVLYEELKHGNALAHPYICHIVCRAYNRGAIRYLRQLNLPRDHLGYMNLLDRFVKVVKCS